jgi:hypothetical protein
MVTWLKAYRMPDVREIRVPDFVHSLVRTVRSPDFFAHKARMGITSPAPARRRWKKARISSVPVTVGTVRRLN